MTARNNIIGKIDWWLLAIYVTLVFIGVSTIYAAAFNEAHPSVFDMSQHYGKQFLFAGVSMFLGLIIMLIDAKFFNAFAYVIYGLSILFEDSLAKLSFFLTFYQKNNCIFLIHK